VAALVDERIGSIEILAIVVGGAPPMLVNEHRVTTPVERLREPMNSDVPLCGHVGAPRAGRGRRKCASSPLEEQL
jgi:hypothetical protein